MLHNNKTFDVDTNIANSYSLWTAIHWASVYGDHEIVKMLLSKGASPCLPDARGYFPIDLAGYFGHVDTVKLLIEKTLEKFESLHQEITKKADLTGQKT